MRRSWCFSALVSSAAVLAASSAGAQTAYYYYYGSGGPPPGYAASPPPGYEASPPAGYVAARPQIPQDGSWSPHAIHGFLARHPAGDRVYAEPRAYRIQSPHDWRPTNLVPRSYYRQPGLAAGGAAAFTPQTLALTREAVARYSRIVAAGGWPRIPTTLRPGSRGRMVALLRRRLAIEGDLAAAGPGGASGVWTPDLTRAVKRYQERVGLPQTGVVAGATLQALNVSAEARLRALQATATRLAALNFSFGPRYVVVNIPGQQVEAVDNGRVVGRYIAIVGSSEHHSPQLSVKAQTINLNPTWTVPDSIIKNEIIPRMRRDPGYLARERIRVIDHKGAVVSPSKIDWRNDSALNYILRQDSGPHDALGQLRIDMPNGDAVYMHSTDEKYLFNRSQRFLSHGCVRIKGVDGLAAWLLKDTPGGPDGRWTLGAIKAGIATAKQINIPLARPVPIAWVYMTGWADANGVVHFRNDVYHKDDEGADVARAD